MPALARLVLAFACIAGAATAVQAQRSVQPATNVVPSSSARAAQAAPRPGGLRPIFPAGISSGSGAAQSTDPIAASTSPIPPAGAGVEVGGSAGRVTVGGFGSRIIAPVDTTAAAAATAVMGAGATVRGPGQRLEGGAGGFSATDIARSFFFADANKDGDLTRAEAGRLSIATMSFEEMDRNYDGLISRFEYDDSVR